MKTLGWIIFGFFAITIGLYPIVYALSFNQGLVSSKPPELVADMMWKSAFILHIAFGGLSLLTGWTQFSRRIRNNYVKIHRLLGKTYVIAVAISGLAGFHIAMYANGGMISTLGFSGLAIAWLFTTMKAFQLIRKREFDLHENWMIRSYALAFAAVTLRIYLPTFPAVFGLAFNDAYQIIAWACWVPNLFVAELIIYSRSRPRQNVVSS